MMLSMRLPKFNCFHGVDEIIIKIVLAHAHCSYLMMMYMMVKANMITMMKMMLKLMMNMVMQAMMKMNDEHDDEDDDG